MATSLQNSSIYFWSKQTVAVGAVGWALVQPGPYSVVTAVALSILTIGHATAKYSGAKALSDYFFIKMTMTAVLSVISAVAILSIVGSTLTLSSVSILAGVLFAPSFAESMIELCFCSSTEATRLDEEYKTALDYFHGFHGKKRIRKRPLSFLINSQKGGTFPLEPHSVSVIYLV